MLGLSTLYTLKLVILYLPNIDYIILHTSTFVIAGSFARLQCQTCSIQDPAEVQSQIGRRICEYRFQCIFHIIICIELCTNII